MRVAPPYLEIGMGSDTDSRVRERAYQLWEESGRPDGREHEHWAQAEREIAVGASLVQPSATSAKSSVPASGETTRKRAPAKAKSGRS